MDQSIDLLLPNHLPLELEINQIMHPLEIQDHLLPKKVAGERLLQDEGTKDDLVHHLESQDLSDLHPHTGNIVKTTLEDLTVNQNLNDQLHHLVNEHEVNDQKQGDHEDLRNEVQHLVVIDGEGRSSF